MWLPVGTDGCLELSPSKVQKSKSDVLNDALPLAGVVNRNDSNPFLTKWNDSCPFLKRLRPTHPARFSHASQSLGGLTVTVPAQPLLSPKSYDSTGALFKTTYAEVFGMSDFLQVTYFKDY